MYDLNAITVVKNRLRPFVPTHHIAVQLDGQALGRKRKFSDQILQGRPGGHVAIITVYLESQEVC